MWRTGTINLRCEGTIPNFHKCEELVPNPRIIGTKSSHQLKHWYQIITCEKFVSKLTRMKNWYKTFLTHLKKLVPNYHRCEELVLNRHGWQWQNCEELESNAKCSRFGGYFINERNTHVCYIKLCEKYARSRISKLLWNSTSFVFSQSVRYWYEICDRRIGIHSSQCEIYEVWNLFDRAQRGKKTLCSCSLAQPAFNPRPLSAHKWNTIRMAFRWWVDGADPLFDVNWVLASPASIQCRATIGVGPHSNGVSFAGI